MEADIGKSTFPIPNWRGWRKRRSEGLRRKQKKKMMSHLSEDLIIPILMRLPVKSLLRFKCVCKSWLSIISHPHFAKSHFELAAAPTHRLLYFPTSTYDSQTRSIDLDASLDDDSASVASVLNFLPPINSQILGSCRGFILFHGCFNMYLWNPSTSVYKSLSLSPIESNINVHFFTFLCGFGYDPSTDDYLVVQASYNPHVDLETHFELFSLRANVWKNIESTHLCYMNASDEPRFGTLLNGVIHWLAFRFDVSVNVIVAFDLIDRSFSEVPLPPDFYQDPTFCGLYVLGGLLSLYDIGDTTVDIWVMKEYKMQSSWTKSIVLSLDHLPTQCFYPICATKSGDTIGIDGSAGLAKYNARGQLLEHRSYCDESRRCEAIIYTESLLSLPLDNEQPAEDV